MLRRVLVPFLNAAGDADQHVRDHSPSADLTLSAIKGRPLEIERCSVLGWHQVSKPLIELGLVHGLDDATPALRAGLERGGDDRSRIRTHSPLARGIVGQ
jgi:hypothetical protein